MNVLLLGLGLGQAELTQLILHGTALPHIGIASANVSLNHRERVHSSLSLLARKGLT